jgi:hypothetical protein
MSTSIPSAPLTTLHRQFENALPAMDRVIRFAFRRWPAHRRHEAADDARSAAWHAWHGLVRRGRDPLRVGPTGIAANACRYVRRGRKLGCGSTGRSAIDVYDPRARDRLGYRLVTLDDAVDGTGRDGWLASLACDRRSRPADEAAFRVDFTEWLGRLPGRRRRIAELLAEGQMTSEVARRLGVTPGAISQARAALARSWGDFQAQAAAIP